MSIQVIQMNFSQARPDEDCLVWQSTETRPLSTEQAAALFEKRTGKKPERVYAIGGYFYFPVEVKQ